MEYSWQKLFPDFPEEFALVEDLCSYLNANVIPIENTLLRAPKDTFEHSYYPVIESSQSIVQFIGQILPQLSDTFTLTMMSKHRFAD